MYIIFSNPHKNPCDSEIGIIVPITQMSNWRLSEVQ